VDADLTFAVKREVLEELLRDPVWRRRLEEARTLREVQRILLGFARERGYRVKVVGEGKKAEGGGGGQEAGAV
jgi:hypothetical protein